MPASSFNMIYSEKERESASASNILLVFVQKRHPISSFGLIVTQRNPESYDPIKFSSFLKLLCVRDFCAVANIWIWWLAITPQINDTMKLQWFDNLSTCYGWDGKKLVVFVASYTIPKALCLCYLYLYGFDVALHWHTLNLFWLAQVHLLRESKALCELHDRYGTHKLCGITIDSKYIQCNALFSAFSIVMENIAAIDF